MRPARTGACIAFAALLRAHEAAAEPEESMSLTFEREPALERICPDRERFLALLRAQRPKIVLAAEGTPARSFVISLRREGAAMTGDLVIIELDGTTNARSLHEASCPALVSALAVVTAIALDEHSLAPSSRPEVEEHEAPDPPHAAAPRRHVPPPRARPPSAPLRTDAAVGLDTEIVLGSLPHAVMGYRAYGEAQRPLRAWLVGGRLSFAFARAQLADTQRIDVFVQIWSARGEGCAGRPIARGLVLEGCAGLTLGVHHSYSTHALGARDDLRPWLTLDVGPRLRWRPAESAYFAEIYGVGSYVATAYTTVARDGSGAEHDVPRGIGQIGIGLGRSFYFP